MLIVHLISLLIDFGYFYRCPVLELMCSAVNRCLCWRNVCWWSCWHFVGITKNIHRSIKVYTLLVLILFVFVAKSAAKLLVW